MSLWKHERLRGKGGKFLVVDVSRGRVRGNGGKEAGKKRVEIDFSEGGEAKGKGEGEGDERGSGISAVEKGGWEYGGMC